LTTDPIAELEQTDRLEDAARLAEQLGQHQRALALWERSCDFANAARAALAASDPKRAVLHAARAGIAEYEQAAIAALLDHRETAEAAAVALARRGDHAVAARLWLALGELARAAEQWSQSGHYLEAARAHVARGDHAAAAAQWRRHLQRNADAHDVRFELGTHLLQSGETIAGIAELQRIPPARPEHAWALAALPHAFRSLGLLEAARWITARVPASLPERTSSRNARQTASAPLLFGRYAVVRHVATTPVARLLEAIDRISGERVAIKVMGAFALHPAGREALRRASREAMVLGELRHPNIVALRAYIPDGPALVLHWMSGGSLTDLLTSAPISPARAVQIVSQVLRALGEAHRRGILHRDVKPSNVLFDDAANAHLSDFGIAHISDAGATVTAGVLGTLAYMAPEVRGGARATPSTDVYGAGAILWHALTGAPPGGAATLVHRHLHPAARAVAERLIGDSAIRPSTAAEAQELLSSVSWASELPDRNVSAVPRPSSATPRFRELSPGVYEDTWLRRRVRALDATSENRERLPRLGRSVLAHDRERHVFWVTSDELNEPAEEFADAEGNVPESTGSGRLSWPT
jgi:serine/threonine-protein kinase